MDTDLTNHLGFLSHGADVDLTDFAVHFNKNVRPLLDAVHELHNLNVITKESIPDLTIVVIGDQNTEKATLVETLTGVCFPQEQGCATTVPQLLRLETCLAGENCRQSSDEYAEAIQGVANAVGVESSLSLLIKRPNAPDVTVINLPGIRARGEDTNDYDQIAATVKHILKTREMTTILNVVPATTTISTCESTRLSKEVDELGERTLVVAITVDKSLDLKSDNDTGSATGYTCVIRCWTDAGGSQKRACKIEKQFFYAHPSLCQLDKMSALIQDLAERITMLQAKMIRSYFNVITGEIKQAVSETQKVLDDDTENGLPRDGNPSDWLLQIMLDNTATIQDRMQRGNYSIRLWEFFQRLITVLDNFVTSYVLDETKTERILKEMTDLGINALPHPLSRSLLETLICEAITNVSECCTQAVIDTHTFAETFFLDIDTEAVMPFPVLMEMYSKIAKEAIGASLDACMDFVHCILDKEKSTMFTLNKVYKQTVESIPKCLTDLRTITAQNTYFTSTITIAGIVHYVNTNEFRKTPAGVPALEMKMYLVAYLSVAFARMANEFALEVRYRLKDALVKNLNNLVWRR